MLIYYGLYNMGMNKIKIEKKINPTHFKEPEKYGIDQYILSIVDQYGKTHEISIIELWGHYEVLVCDANTVKEFTSFHDALNASIEHLSLYNSELKK